VSYKATRKLSASLLAAILLQFAACSTEKMPGGGLPASLAEVPSVRLNYRYEADVPAPEAPEKPPAEEKHPPVLADFDQNRQQELLDRTITSPDLKRVLAVYHRAGDAPAEFRLDMYSADGRVLRKVTSDLMSVHFPDTIRWAPDSSAVAFVAMLRGASAEPTPMGGDAPVQEPAAPTPAPAADANAAPADNANTEPPADPNAATPAAAPTPAAPTGILTFRTEQIYTCSADGDNTRPITQNEGFMYF